MNVFDLLADQIDPFCEDRIDAKDKLVRVKTLSEIYYCNHHLKIEVSTSVEKIVIKEVEVPKEIETLRKEMVYVPLPTDDEELLKKGPFKAPDYDKDKKKK